MKLRPAVLLIGLAALAGCEGYGPVPPPPPLTPNPPGGVYRAVGTEPFWDLTINERQMVFTDRGNNVQVAQPTPRVIIGVAGEIYQSPRLNVNIVHRQCSDGMSDRVYPDTVQVTVDGRQYRGCGGH
jgi:heat shock protein HslJ